MFFGSINKLTVFVLQSENISFSLSGCLVESDFLPFSCSLPPPLFFLLLHCQLTSKATFPSSLSNPSFLCLSLHLFLLFSSGPPAQEEWSLACWGSVPSWRAWRLSPVRLLPLLHQTMCFPLAGCCGNHRSFPSRGSGCGTWIEMWRRRGSCCAVFPNGPPDSGALRLPEAHPGSFLGRSGTVWGRPAPPPQTLTLASWTFQTNNKIVEVLLDSPLSLSLLFGNTYQGYVKLKAA